MTAIVEYTRTEAKLAELADAYAGVTYEVATTAGMRLAIAARAELRDWRVGLEKTRKEIKAPALERCQQIDAEAKRITTKLVALEDPSDAQIKAEEGRKEAARVAKERAEIERLAAIAAAEEAERRRVEAEALAAERTELARQRAEIEAAATEQRRLDDEARAVREAADRAAAAVRAEAERVAAAARAEADRKAAAEREAEAAFERAIAESEREALKAREDALRFEEQIASTARDAEARRKNEEDVARQAELLAEEQAQEARRIGTESLLGAACDALELLGSLGKGGHIVTRTLAAAIERAKP